MAKRRGNKSAKIRQYFSDHPEASAAEVAKALNVKPALVYNVKANMKAKTGGVGRKRGRRRAAGIAGNGSAEQVIAAARLIRACGGVEGAKQALRAAEQVAGALGD